MATLTFDDLIPGQKAGRADARPTSNGGVSFDDLIPEANVGGRPVDASPMDYAVDSYSVNSAHARAPGQVTQAAGRGRNPSFFAMMLEGEKNNQLAASQRTDPSVYDGDRLLRKQVGRIIPPNSDYGNVPQGSYVGEDGNVAQMDPSRHVVLVDPATGHPTVYERNRDAEGTDKTEEPLWKSFGRMVLPGLVTGPVTGPQRAAQAATNASRVARNAQRATDAADDLMSFERAQVPVFAPAFQSAPARITAKGLADTKFIGAPVRNALDDTFYGMRATTDRVADNLSPGLNSDTAFSQAGTTLQRGLDRFRTAGVRDIEPGVLAERGINPMAPIPPRQVMSQGAESRAAQAAPIRAQNAGGVAETSRGVQVPAARSLDQTILARRAIEDMDDAQVLALTRSPAGETSFAVRSEALYERAHRQLPTQMRMNETANPQLLQATNTRNTINALRAEQERTAIPGGVINGRFAGLADRVQQNVTLPTLRAMRTAIGRELGNFNYAEMGLDRTQLNALYRSISRDIEIAYQDLANRAHIASRFSNNAPNYVPPATARAADRALYEFRRADRYFRQGVQRMDTFLSAVDAKNPELAARRLVQAATGGGKGDIAMFRNAMSALRPEERSEFASLVIRNMGQPAASARGVVQEAGFSPSTFVTNYQKLDPRARALIFPGEHGRAVEDLFRVANRIANVETFANTSNSGRMAVNLGGAAAAAGSLATGNWAPILGAALGGYGMSLVLSRPSLARWSARYLALRAAASRGGASAGGVLNRAAGSPMTAHINRLAQLAQKDPEIYQFYRLIAEENGIVEGGEGNGAPEGNAGVEHGEPEPQRELNPSAHGVNGNTGQGVSPRRFDPPMRLGGPGSGEGVLGRTAPRPGDAPPQAEMRSYNPSPSESAAFNVRQGAEAIGLPSTTAERIGSAAGGAVNLLTPLDDVSSAVESGTAADAAMAGFSLIPGFRGGKKAAEAALPALRSEVEGLMSQYRRLTGEARPLPRSVEPVEEQMSGLNDLKTWLTRELEQAGASRPQSAATSVPVTSSPQQEEVLRFIQNNPYTQSIPGRQGFPSKSEQEQLAREFFRAGGEMPAAPWGHTLHSATEDVRRILGEAHAAGRKVSRQAQEAAEKAAKKSDDAAKELADLRQKAGLADARSEAMGRLRKQLEAAEKKAKFYEDEFNKIKKRAFPGSSD